MCTDFAFLSVFDASRMEREVAVNINKIAVTIDLKNRVGTMKHCCDIISCRAMKKNFCVLTKEFCNLHIFCDPQRICNAVSSRAYF